MTIKTLKIFAFWHLILSINFAHTMESNSQPIPSERPQEYTSKISTELDKIFSRITTNSTLSEFFKNSPINFELSRYSPSPLTIPKDQDPFFETWEEQVMQQKLDENRAITALAHESKRKEVSFTVLLAQMLELPYS